MVWIASSLPRTVNCVYNEYHKMQLKHKLDEDHANKSCNKCSCKFNEILFQNELITPHYYSCKICRGRLCFNCVVYNDETWDEDDLESVLDAFLRKQLFQRVLCLA